MHINKQITQKCFVSYTFQLVAFYFRKIMRATKITVLLIVFDFANDELNHVIYFL